MNAHDTSAAVRPLAGPGFVARSGELLLVCAEGAAGVEDLLILVNEVAASGGDGSVLVRKAAALLANDFEGRFPACALSGPTMDGRLAVLVFGAATADVVGGEGEVSLSGVDAITPVGRLVFGPIKAIRLQLLGAGPANPRSRLERGVVSAAGVVYSRAPEERPGAPAAPMLPTASESEIDVHDPLVAPPPEPMAETPPEPAALPQIREPDPAAPFVSVLLGPDAADDAEEPIAPIVDSEMRPRVRGVFCKNNHFNDPSLRYCSVCGISMAQQTLVPFEGPRPPLGVLLLDDGSTFRLDLDYVIGREPQIDPDVIAGTARPMRVGDAEGVVSRRHARVSLVGWDVHVTDLGSANGTFVQPSGDRQGHPLVPNQPVVVQPGTQVMIGGRWFRYESHRNP